MSYAIHTELVYIYNLIAVKLFLNKNKKIIFPSFCFWLFAAYNYESIIAHTCFFANQAAPWAVRMYCHIRCSP